jgi:hypothetical protein
VNGLNVEAESRNAGSAVLSRLLVSEVLVLLAQVDVHFEHTDSPMGVTARELIQKILSAPSPPTEGEPK